MAETGRAVWGIDIGQAGLKAIRLRYAEAADQVVAVAFDYIPHPKILTQPDAIPEQLISEALGTFLSRNDVTGDIIAISVPGQSALIRFIQLPPVEPSKVAEIVKYEAKQQIPFALDEVIWDYQPLGGGSQESGFMLEAEVGLFAMKKDLVAQHLKPFTDANQEVEVIQIAPLALYNYLSYDIMGIREDTETEDDEEYTIILDMGADNTTLLVSNGSKIWTRNVPIGGNHFTRALTKEMKLTFAKAEHLKCNATKSTDPRAVFQALRPVFNSYVTEIQRSIGYFSSVNRNAKISKVLGLGNGFRLAGLQKFLQQHLQYDVEKIVTFDGLAGDNVLDTALFQENILTFAVPYGLALQGLQLTRIKTTLLPPEIKLARTIRKKKPWAVATAATLLLGLATSSMGSAFVESTVSEELFRDSQKKTDTFSTSATNQNAEYNTAATEYETKKAEQKLLLANPEDRIYWLEVYKAINACLPRDIGEAKDQKDITKRKRIDIKKVVVEDYNHNVPGKESLKVWSDFLSEGEKASMEEEDAKKLPEGEGYVFTVYGEHYYQPEEENAFEMEQEDYVKNTFLKNLRSWKIEKQGRKPVPVKQIGISHSYLYHFDYLKVPDPTILPPAKYDFVRTSQIKKVSKTIFAIKFVWIPVPLDKRLDQDPAKVKAPAANTPPAANKPPAETKPAVSK